MKLFGRGNFKVFCFAVEKLRLGSLTYRAQGHTTEPGLESEFSYYSLVSALPASVHLSCIGGC